MAETVGQAVPVGDHGLGDLPGQRQISGVLVAMVGTDQHRHGRRLS